jgi:hypothetical protein
MCIAERSPVRKPIPPWGIFPKKYTVTDGTTAVGTIHVPKLWPKTRRKMLGRIMGSAVKLAPVTNGTLAIAEGIETALAANQMGHGPAWAAGSAIAVERFPVLSGIRRLILLEENNEASREAVAACARRWIAAEREVFRVVPEHGDDLNDELMFQKEFSND